MTVLTYEQRITALEREIAELKGETGWKKVGDAAKILGKSPSNIIYKLQTKPNIYKEGKTWKWNREKTYRLINIAAWRKADAKL